MVPGATYLTYHVLDKLVVTYLNSINTVKIRILHVLMRQQYPFSRK